MAFTMSWETPHGGHSTALFDGVKRDRGMTPALARDVTLCAGLCQLFVFRQGACGLVACTISGQSRQAGQEAGGCTGCTERGKVTLCSLKGLHAERATTMLRQTSCVVVAAACAVASAIAAATPVSPTGGGLVHKAFAMLDVTRDGVVTTEDMHWWAQALEHDDEVIGASEATVDAATPAARAAANAAAAAGTAVQQRVRSAVARLDTNGDGAVTFEEFRDVVRASGLLDGQGAEAPVPTWQPVQVHATNDGDSVLVVQWVTGAHTNASVVQYGTSPGTLASSAAGSQATYHAGDLQNTSWGFHGYIHTVRVPIADRRRTYYRCGDGDASHWSALFSMQVNTSAVTGVPTTLAWQGDMGTYIPSGHLVAGQMLADHNAEGLDAVSVVGDISYATIGFPSMKDEFEFVWDLWGAMMQPLASSVPLHTTVGNHESPDNFTAYTARFAMPSASSGGWNNNWYSYDVGRVHVTSFSTEHAYDPGTPQMAWIEADLAKAHANRAERPWVVVTGHRPMYCSDTFAPTSARVGAHLQRVLEPVLHKFEVDLFIGGHHHVYERSWPINNGSATGTTSGNVYLDPPDPVHVTVGSGGAFYPEGWRPDRPDWSAARAIEYGYSHMAAFNTTHLRMQFRPLTNQSAADEFWIVRSKAPGP